MRRKPQTPTPGDDPQTAATRIERRERSLDEALDASFPASDPPAALAPHSAGK
jgi:hypothetical protein